MRKVIYSLSVSLDGFIETPNRELDWVIVDEELHTFFNDQAREMDAFLYGRRMYELMIDYWPTADTNPSAPAFEVEFARIWKKTPKIVFSKTLDKVEWNSRLIKDNIAEEIAKLKAQPGKDLGLGGADIASTFMQLGLIDEYQLFVNPVVLGGGTPFFPALGNPIHLRLVETRTFGSGVVYLRYQLDKKEPK
jgi:dihydrofolate reductase